jgi:hypothetical protein
MKTRHPIVNPILSLGAVACLAASSGAFAQQSGLYDPSRDVFLDIENDPWAGEEGRELGLGGRQLFRLTDDLGRVSNGGDIADEAREHLMSGSIHPHRSSSPDTITERSATTRHSRNKTQTRHETPFARGSLR